LTVTVPEGAQQVLIFLAPETGGDFQNPGECGAGAPRCIRTHVAGPQPGGAGSLSLGAVLSAIRTLNDSDPSKLTEAAPLLARSLAIKVDEKCLDKLPPLQAPCLTQGQESLILNERHSTSIVEALTSGPGSDLAMEASYTPQLSYGYYSPYVASVLDIARIFDSFHTAHYQYIPALASLRGDKLALTLNAAPSFHNPQSVLVAGTAGGGNAPAAPFACGKSQRDLLRRQNRSGVAVDGAPLGIFERLRHDATLSLTGKDGKSIDLPAGADAVRGGYVVDTAALHSATWGQRARDAAGILGLRALPRVRASY